MVEVGVNRCQYCGSAIAGSNKFCPSCGARQVITAPMQPATRYCPNCGNQNSASATFCPRCGTNLQTPWMPSYQAAPPSGSVNYQPKSKGRSVMIVLAVVLVAVVLIAVIIGSGLLSIGGSGNAKTGDGDFTWTYEG